MNGIEVVATTASPAFAVDLRGRILAWNRAAEASLGYRRSEVLDHRCWEVLKGRDLSANRYCTEYCAVRDMVRRGEPVHRTLMTFRNAAGGRTRASLFTLVVRGAADKEIVHLLQCQQAPVDETRTRERASTDSNARLSRRQLEVLQHLGDGKRTEEIAELLCITPATVRHHIHHILARLKVHSRLEAVALARRIGLL